MPDQTLRPVESHPQAALVLATRWRPTGVTDAVKGGAMGLDVRRIVWPQG